MRLTIKSSEIIELKKIFKRYFPGWIGATPIYEWEYKYLTYVVYVCNESDIDAIWEFTTKTEHISILYPIFSKYSTRTFNCWFRLDEYMYDEKWFIKSKLDFTNELNEFKTIATLLM